MSTAQRLDPVDRMTALTYAQGFLPAGDRSLFSPLGETTTVIDADGQALDPEGVGILASPTLLVSSILVAGDGVTGRLTVMGTPDRLFLGRADGDAYVVLEELTTADLAERLADQCCGAWRRTATAERQSVYAWMAGVVLDGDRVVAGADLTAFPPEADEVDDDDLGPEAVRDLAEAFEEVLRGPAAAGSPRVIGSDDDLDALLAGDDDLLFAAQEACFELLLVSETVGATLISGPAGTIVLAGDGPGEDSVVALSNRGLLGELAAQLELVRDALPKDDGQAWVTPVAVRFLSRPGRPPELGLAAEVLVTARGSALSDPDAPDAHIDLEVDGDREALALIASALVDAARAAMEADPLLAGDDLAVTAAD